jgi:hypothetical protein
MVAMLLPPIPIPTKKQSDKLPRGRPKERAPHIPEDIQKSLRQLTVSLRANAILPLLESDTKNFDIKFDEAVKYFSRYMVQLITLINYIQTSRPNVSDQVNESSLSVLSMLKNKFLQRDKDPIALLLADAIATLEDYVLLANDPTIDVNKPKYNPLLGLYFDIWICIAALIEILYNKNTKDYETQAKLLTKKCHDSKELLRDYVMTLAEDYGRKLAPTVINKLEDIDSGKAEMITWESAEAFLKQMDKELAASK